MLALEAVLEVWSRPDVSVDAVSAFVTLTDLFVECVRAYVPEGRVDVVTPGSHAERGSQVALRGRTPVR